MRSIVSLSLLTLLVAGMLLVGGCSVGQLGTPEHEIVSETSDKNSDYDALNLQVVTDEEDGEDVASSLAEQNSDYDYVSVNLFESKTAANRYEQFAYYEYSHTEAGEENFQVAEGEGVYEDNPNAGYEGEAPTEDAMNYGDDEHLDGLYDECEAGDVDACDELYMQSPVDSEYEDFALENGSSYGGETTQIIEAEEVSIGEPFELNGFEWTVTAAAVLEERDVDVPAIEGPYAVLEVEVTNVSDDYQWATENAVVKIYSDRTSYYADNFEMPVESGEDVTEDEMAPGSSRTGVLVASIDHPGETLVEAEWLDSREELYDYEPAFIVDLEGEV